MNNTLKRLIKSEQKRLLNLILILMASLILSALIYQISGKGARGDINYESISKMTFMEIFLKSYIRNIIYFLSLILLTCLGQGRLTKLLFACMSVYYGLSVIYNKNFLLTFTDYFILFPILLYFTFISSSISKYTKKAKNIETISRKFDIIISSYMRISVFYLLLVTVYTLVYSIYVLILSRLMVG